MPGIVALMSAISADVVARLAAAPTPVTLTEGKVLLGRQWVQSQSAAPRIIFIPSDSKFGPRDQANPSQVALNPTAETWAQKAQRAIASDRVHFEVQCWGVTQPEPDVDGDFTATETLYVAVMNSVRALSVGNCGWTDGVWADQKPDAAQLQKFGHLYVFGLWIGTPVIEQILPMATVTTVRASVGFNGGSSEDSVVIVRS